jgi:hypothetical protein
MNYYSIYRLEHGLSAAEQRAADQRLGEMAAALGELRGAVAHSVLCGLGTLKRLSRVNRSRKQASVAAATSAAH